MENLIESAIAQLEQGKELDNVRYHLGFNYPYATCSSIEEAIRAAQLRMKADDLQAERHESDDELGRLYYSDVLDEYGRRLC